MALALNDAEKKFFESGGNDVDKSLGLETAPEPEPLQQVISEQDDTPDPVETPAEKPAPAAKPADDAAAKAARRKAAIEEFGLVDLNAVTEARADAREARRQAQELSQWRQQYEPILQGLKPKEQANQNPYDPTTQPNEWAAWDYQNLQNTVKGLTEDRQRMSQERQATENTQRLMSWGQAQERAYMAQTPDYNDAINFAKAARTKQLAVFNPDPAWIEATINNEIAGIIADSAQKTMQGFPTNPAERAYQYAIANGYTKAEPKENPNEEANQTKIQQGLKAQGGLKGGKAPTGKLTLEDMANRPVPKSKAAVQKWNEDWERLKHGG